MTRSKVDHMLSVPHEASQMEFFDRDDYWDRANWGEPRTFSPAAQAMMDSGYTDVYDREMPTGKWLTTGDDSQGRFRVVDYEEANGMTNFEPGEDDEDFDRWIYDVNPLDYITQVDFNKEFWAEQAEYATALYHASPAENHESIMREGLSPRSKTRGINNRNMGSAIFASPSSGVVSHYGDSVYLIDTGAMARDGYTPEVGKESPVEESDLYEALARELGMDFEAGYGHGDGIDSDTVAFYDTIPPKYIEEVGQSGVHESAIKVAVPLAPDDPGLPTTYYHVSPSSNHESIMREGLKPTSGMSPWMEKRNTDANMPDAPAGVYLWDSPENAREYIYALLSMTTQHEMPDESHGWMETNPEWYDWSDGWEPDPDYPEDEPLGQEEEPPGYNIYAIHPDALTDVMMDPENANMPYGGEIDYDKAMGEWEEDGDNVTGHRYYTPHPVPPNAVALHSEVPITDLSQADMYDMMDEVQYVPESLTRVPDLMASPLADPNWSQEGWKGRSGPNPYTPPDDKSDEMLFFPHEATQIVAAVYTGDQEVDGLIDEWKNMNPELYGEVYLHMMQDSKFSDGECSTVSHHFEKFLSSRGVEVRSPSHYGLENPDPTYSPHPDQWGYEDRSIDPGDCGHIATVVDTGSGPFMIDWTATQFGYEEWPMVQRLADEGWDRQDTPLADRVV